MAASLWPISYTAAEPMASLVCCSQAHGRPLLYAAANPMAYSICYRSAHPIAYAATQLMAHPAAIPTSCGTRCCPVHGPQRTSAARLIADIVRLCHAYDLSCVLPPGLLLTVYTAARPTANSVHYCPADGLPCSNHPDNSPLSGELLHRSLLCPVLLC